MVNETNEMKVSREYNRITNLLARSFFNRVIKKKRENGAETEIEGS